MKKILLTFLLTASFSTFADSSSYSGNCLCPYDIASDGSSCGALSAWSKSDGASPKCYASDSASDSNYKTMPYPMDIKKAFMMSLKEYKSKVVAYSISGCEARTPIACSSYPSMVNNRFIGLDPYESGDYATALREWQPLAKQGDSRAQTNLGLMYEYGLGVLQDNKTAKKWYRLAAEQGNPTAQFNLGWLYTRGGVVRGGPGLKENKRLAAKWLKLSAEQGYFDAQYFLSFMYRLGDGVIQDKVTAHMWMNISIANGREDIHNTLGGMEYDMTRSEISEAQKLARECVAKNYKGC